MKRKKEKENGRSKVKATELSPPAEDWIMDQAIKFRDELEPQLRNEKRYYLKDELKLFTTKTERREEAFTRRSIYRGDVTI